MLADEEDFGDTSIADAATRDSSYQQQHPCTGLKPVSSNGNGEVPLQSN